ncbi:MAG: cyanophycinase [Chitinophagaceae bacterium]|nr:cyanophycinase [Chitinophagaceae bacterium]
MNPKGFLVSVGGAEDKGTDLEKGIIDRNRLAFFELGILKNIVSLIKPHEEPVVEVITTASMIPDEVAENYKTAFEKLDCSNVNHLRIRNREDAMKPEFIERIKNCNCVMFSGGNQLRLSSIFGGTELLSLIRQKYNDEHFVIAGTSAGAMAMSNTMIYEGNADKAHLKGEVKITTGLGFMHDVVIDSHFDKRGRFNRLAQAVAAQPGALGIGLGEDTGVIVRHGTELQVIGSGSVVIIDGKFIEYNNIADVRFGHPISIENIVVHMLSNGDKFNTATRKFTGLEIVLVDDDES